MVVWWWWVDGSVVVVESEESWSDDGVSKRAYLGRYPFASVLASGFRGRRYLPLKMTPLPNFSSLPRRLDVRHTATERY